jgi:hypothetical protein
VCNPTDNGTLLSTDGEDSFKNPQLLPTLSTIVVYNGELHASSLFSIHNTNTVTHHFSGAVKVLQEVKSFNIIIY